MLLGFFVCVFFFFGVGGGGGVMRKPLGKADKRLDLLPTGSEERGVLGVRSIPSAILPSCQNMKTMAL